MFCQKINLGGIWPPTVEVFCQYIAFLSLKQYSYSLVGIHLAAISYVNKMNDMQDNTKLYIVKKMIEGLRRTRKRNDNSEPITHDILLQLITVLKSVCRSQYETMMFTAAFCLAFVGLLRLSEFALPHHKSKKLVINIGDITFHKSYMRILIRSSKTD